MCTKKKIKKTLTKQKKKNLNNATSVGEDGGGLNSARNGRKVNCIDSSPDNCQHKEETW